MLLDVEAPRVLGNAVDPRVRFVEVEQSDGRRAGRRVLTVDDEPTFELSFWCGTCQFLFERLQGATTTFSPDDTGALNAGAAGLDQDVIPRFAVLLPEGMYQPLLLEMVPRLVHPAGPGDYFAE